MKNLTKKRHKNVVQTIQVLIGLTLFLLTSNSVKAQYCIPVFSDNEDDCNIENLITTGGSTNINNTATGYGLNGSGYSDYTAQQHISVPGQDIGFSMTQGATTYTTMFYIWIDKNNDQVFDASEQVFVSDNYASSHSGTILASDLPSSPGTYRIRFMSNYYDVDDPCAVDLWGEAEDYTLVIGTPTPCSGTPTAGTAVANPETANAGTTFSVTATSYDVNTGLVYQWEKYNQNTDTWDEVGTASSSFEVLTGQIAPPNVGGQVKYRLKIACNNSNLFAYSTEATFTTQKVYCIPTSTCAIGSKIANFEINDAITNLANETGTTSGSCGSGGYSDFTSIYTVAEETDILSFIVKVGSYSGGVKIWIDWNQNGEFETTEIVGQSSSTISSNNTFTGNFTVPAGTPLGDYRLRVRVVESTTNFTACSLQTYGETEDYTLKVVSQAACTGIPTTGTIKASPFIVAVGQTYNITAQSVSYNTGLVFQWEKSINGGTWVEVGTWSSQYQDFTAQAISSEVGLDIKYRLKITCTNSNQTAYSNEVTLTTIAQAYCVPDLTFNSWYYIHSFQTSNAVTNINNVTNGKSMPNGYGDFTSSHVVQTVPGMIFNFSANLQSNSNQGLAIWIDWNKNGTFEASELMFNSTDYITSTSISGTITVPTNQNTGMYVMRVLNLGYYSDLTIPFVGPCVNGGITSKSGEIEEYAIEVVEITTCSGTPNTGVAEVNPTTANPGAVFSVTASSYSIGLGFTFQWEKYNETTLNWDEVGTSTSEYQPLTGQIAPPNVGDQAKYRLKVTCTNSGETAYSNEAIFTTGVTTYCTPFYSQLCAVSPKIANFEINDAVINLTNNTGTGQDSCGLNGYNDFSSIFAMVTQGSELPFVVSVGSYSGYVKLWID